MSSRKLLGRCRRLVALAALACAILSAAVRVSAQQSKTDRSKHKLRRAHALSLRMQSAEPGPLQATTADAFDPPENTVGERLFLETRFAQYFASHFDGNVNHPLSQGDPTVNFVQTTSGKILGPFAGKSVNCRSCHFVDDVKDGGNRTYADFARRSPVPDRGDGQVTAARNALNMVDSSIPRSLGLLLHGDGEFSSLPALVDSTLTGRNFGWFPQEYDQAEDHIARVIREDDGTGDLARDYGSLSYAKLFLGTSPDIPAELRLPSQYRIDVSVSTDEEVLGAVKRLISAYVSSLVFSRNVDGVHDGSPYDKFLETNNLPSARLPNEAEAAYSRRLFEAVSQLQNPLYVTVGDGAFETHDQKYAFGPLELQGLKLFLRESGDASAYRIEKRAPFLLAAGFPALGFVFLGLVSIRNRRYGLLGMAIAGALSCGLIACGQAGSGSTPQIPVVEAKHAGNCATCHVPPNFTDFGMHNTGASQEEYDAVHGDGAFSELAVPGYAERQLYSDDYLPPTPAHPLASGRFRSPASASDSRLADLGLWNVYANPAFPEPQSLLQNLMCDQGSACDPNQVLPLTIGRFKTPTLRDLGHSQPYLHTGRMDSIEKVMDFYRHVAVLAQAGKLRNADPAIAGVSIDSNDAAALAAFLRALNEDYD
jgi:cytochrome c peroxidase